MQNAMISSHQKHLVSTVKYGAERSEDLSLFRETGPRKLVVIETSMSSTLYWKILRTNVRTSTCQFKLGQNWVMKQDNNPKHTSELTS